MSDSIDRVRSELASLGYETTVFQSSQGVVVSFDYTIEVGSQRGRSVTVGVSFQEDGYPEYPPHWIHVTPPIDDGRGGSAVTYSDDHGRSWFAMSRPPGDMWDQLPTKHMYAFINEHLRRIWADV